MTALRASAVRVLAIVPLLAVLSQSAGAHGQITLGAMGDSYSDEYHLIDPKSLPEGFYNWVELMVVGGRGDFGPLAFFANANDPRHGVSGYSYTYNFALGGATTESLLGNGPPGYRWSQCGGPPPYHLIWGGFREHADSGAIEYGVLEIAGNDFLGGVTGGWAILTPPNAVTIQIMADILNNYTTGLDIATDHGDAPVKMIVCNLPDLGSFPLMDLVGLTPEQKANMRSHVELWNEGVAFEAFVRGYPVLDLWTWWENVRLNGLTVHGIPIDVLTPGPPNYDLTQQDHFFISDGLHPTPVGQATLANVIIQTFIDGYGESRITPLSGKEMVTLTGLDPQQPPSADAGGPYAIDAGQTLILDASGSSDPNPGDELSFAWDLDDDGEFDDADGAAPSVSWSQLASLGYEAGGSYSLAVRVDDGYGGVAVASASIAVGGCNADVNGDGVVDLSDLSGLLAHFGLGSGALHEEGDLDGDGDVDLEDLSNLLVEFGMACG